MSYIDYPPLQMAASYNLEQVLQQVKEMGKNTRASRRLGQPRLPHTWRTVRKGRPPFVAAKANPCNNPTHDSGGMNHDRDTRLISRKDRRLQDERQAPR